MVAAGSILFLSSILGVIEYRQSEYKLRQKISSLFEQSIYEEIKLKMSEEFVFIHKGSDLTLEKKTIKNQTIVTADTTITKEAEVSDDLDLELLKSSQSYLLLRRRIQPDTLQQLFDSKLNENGLKIASVILVRYDHNMQTSGDTTQIHVDYRIPAVRGGVYGEITYEGLIDYSPFTVFRSMAKSEIIVLLTLEILMLIAIFYLFLKKSEIKPDKIAKRGRYYYIGVTVFDIRKNELIGQRSEVIPVTRKPAEMLLMFLKSADHVVEKSVLKETLWSDHPYTANKSLMSTINKLRNYLKDVGCAFSIITKKGDDYYVLKYMQEDTEVNDTDTVTLIASPSPSATVEK